MERQRPKQTPSRNTPIVAILKIAFALILFFLMMTVGWASSGDKPQGDGTSNDPYLIETLRKLTD